MWDYKSNVENATPFFKDRIQFMKNIKQWMRNARD